jgi:hypothetical protein
VEHRIEEVRVALRHGTFVIRSASREALLRRLQQLSSANDIVDVFQTGGTPRPVL